MEYFVVTKELMTDERMKWLMEDITGKEENIESVKTYFDIMSNFAEDMIKSDLINKIISDMGDRKVITRDELGKYSPYGDYDKIVDKWIEAERRYKGEIY